MRRSNGNVSELLQIISPGRFEELQQTIAVQHVPFGIHKCSSNQSHACSHLVDGFDRFRVIHDHAKNILISLAPASTINHLNARYHDKHTNVPRCRCVRCGAPKPDGFRGERDCGPDLGRKEHLARHGPPNR